MSAIRTDFGTGGSNLTPGGSSGQPSLAEVLRDVADDLAGIRGGGATITASALPAFTDPPSAAEMAALRTLVNEMRAVLVASTGTTLKTTKA